MGLAYTPDRVRIDKQDHSSEHLSCNIPTLQLQNSKLIKERNWKDGSNNEKLLTVKDGIHHQKTDHGRLYAKRQKSGHGLVKLESAHNAAIVGLSKYIMWGKDRFTRLVQEFDSRKAKYTLQKKLLL